MCVRRVVVVVLFACAPALAAEPGALAVGANVVSHRPAVRVHADFPVPAQGSRLTFNPFGGSWYVPGAMHDTATFYRDAMARRGYRALADDTRDGLVRLRWERDGERVEIRLQPVLGASAGTRMIVSADAG